METATATKPVANGKTEIATVKADNGKVLSLVEIGNNLDKLKSGTKIESFYLTFDAEKGIPMGVEVKVFMIGITTMRGMGEKKDQMVDAVSLVKKDDDGVVKKYITADSVIVGFAKQRVLPMAVAITWKGWVEGAKGSYRDFQFNELNG